MLSRGSVRIAAGLAAGFLVLVACGGGHVDAEGTATCDGTPLSPDAIRLPSDFPIPAAAVLTSSSKAGPSQVVDGYFRGGLEAAYHGWRDALDGAHYTVLFDEIEERDSEISYKAGDGSSTGQVSLRSECGEADRTALHITNRPA